jgi:WD40 repeat protein
MGHSSCVGSIACSPDGKTVLSGSWDNTLKLWDAASGKLIRTFTGHSSGVYSVAYSPDGKTVLSGSGDSTLKLWDVTSGKEIRTFAGHTRSVSSVAYSPDGKTIISGADDKTLKIWDVASGKEIRTFTGFSSFISSITYSPDCKTILSASAGLLILWDVSSGKKIRTFTGHSGGVSSVAYSPDGKTVLSGATDRTIKLWDVSSGREIRTFTGHSGYVQAVAYSPDGRTVLSGSWDNTLKLWDVENGKEIRTFTGHTRDIKSVAFSPDGKTVMSGANDNTLKFWDVASGKEIRTCNGHFDDVSSVAYSPDGLTFLSGAFDNTLKLWDAASGKLIRTCTGHTGRVFAVAFSPDGKTVLSGAEDKTMKLWNVPTGKEIRTFTGHSGSVLSVAYSPDGKTVLSGSNDTMIKLWDIASGKVIRTFMGNLDSVTSVAYSPDGKTVLSGLYGANDDKKMKLWDVASGKLIRTFPVPVNSDVWNVAYSPDGKTVLSGLSGDVLKLWDVASGKEIRTFIGHSYIVSSVAFSPDGKNILSGSFDNTLKLWDVASGKEIRAFTGHSGYVQSVAYSPDGKTVLSGSTDGTIYQWDVSTGALLTGSIASNNGDWLTWTPEGFFAGTDWATHNLVHFVDGINVIGIDQVYDVYYRPDLVAAKAAGKDISEYTKNLDLASLLNNGGFPPLVEIVSPSTGPVNARDITVRLRVTDQGGGVGKITVFNGDSPVVLSDGSGRGIKVVESNKPITTGKVYEYEALLTLRAGANTISLAAYNKNNTIESRRAFVDLQYGSAIVAKPSLYILAVAVQKYRDHDLQLKYTVEDAKAIIAAFQKQTGNLYQKVSVMPLFDEAVTREGFGKAFDDLAGQVKSDDVFVLYFAGHGVTNDKDGEYYFLPVNFRFNGMQSIVDQGISKTDIMANIVKIPAQKSLLLFDTCNSGSFLSAPGSRGIAEKTAVDRLIKGVGRAMIVASASDQVALEGYESHGVFTFALLQALSGAADTGQTGYVTIKSLSTYVESAVPDLTYNKWGYEQVPQSWLPNQDFPVAGAGNK